MIAYPDTSFLCALYREQDNSERALTYRDTMSEPLHVTRLLLWEFRQSVRFQAFRHSNNRNVREFDIEKHRRWMNETWGDRVFSAEEVKEMREAELGDRS